MSLSHWGDPYLLKSKPKRQLLNLTLFSSKITFAHSHLDLLKVIWVITVIVIHCDKCRHGKKKQFSYTIWIQSQTKIYSYTKLPPKTTRLKQRYSKVKWVILYLFWAKWIYKLDTYLCRATIIIQFYNYWCNFTKEFAINSYPSLDFDLEHSLRLNAELATRAWVILDYLIVGVKQILRSVINDLYAPFMKLEEKNWKNVQNHFFTYFSFKFLPTVHNGKVSRGMVCCCGS